MADWLEGIYRFSLRLLPRATRVAVGGEMLETYRRVVREARTRGGPWSSGRASLAEVLDVVGTALRGRRPGARGAVEGTHRHGGRKSRGKHGGRMIETVFGELRMAGRGLRRTPGFTVLAVLTLALGIAGVTAMFAFVDGVLVRPLPYEGADRLVEVWRRVGEDGVRPGLDAATARAWRNQRSVFEAFTTMATGTVLVTGNDEPERIATTWIAEDLLSFLGVAPMLGRAFAPGESEPGAERVVLLSEAQARLWFGGAELALGKDVRLDDALYRVVGVMPDWFRFPQTTTMVYLPLQPTERAVARFGEITGLARLRRGLDAGSANEALKALAARLSSDGSLVGASGAYVSPLWWAQVPANTRTALVILLGAVGFVLLIACLNAANLALARTNEREREMAVRAALGAARYRLARLALFEAGLTAAGAGALGVVLARLAVRWGLSSAPAELGLLRGGRSVALDGTALLVAGGVTLLCLLAFSAAPIWRAMRSDPRGALGQARGGSAGRHTRHTRAALVSIEVAAALLLLVGGGLLIRSYGRLASVDAGVDTEHVLAVDIRLPRGTYPGPSSQNAFFREAQRRLEELPGVRGVAYVSEAPPLSRMAPGLAIQLENSPTVVSARLIPNPMVGPGYFAVTGIRMVAGRPLEGTDAGTATTVISKGLADRLAPGGDVVGRRVRFRKDRPWETVVGVAADVRQADLGVSVEGGLEFYDLASPGRPQASGSLMVRADGDPLVLVPAIKERIWQLDPNLPLPSLLRLGDRYRATLARPRFYASLMTAFAALATLLATAGIFAVVAYTVSRRTREIGIRMALGAHRRDVLWMVVRSVALIAGGGILAGIAATLVLGRFLQGLLFQVQPTDPLTLAAVSALLLLVSLAAGWLPALRAAHVDPVHAVSAE